SRLDLVDDDLAALVLDRGNLRHPSPLSPRADAAGRHADPDRRVSGLAPRHRARASLSIPGLRPRAALCPAGYRLLDGGDGCDCAAGYRRLPPADAGLRAWAAPGKRAGWL
ncbi:MAG: hypothetical protein AVDCRST_MAG26-3971, partial [uncultured Chloroflexia bacterium]